MKTLRIVLALLAVSLVFATVEIAAESCVDPKECPSPPEKDEVPTDPDDEPVVDLDECPWYKIWDPCWWGDEEEEPDPPEEGPKGCLMGRKCTGPGSCENETDPDTVGCFCQWSWALWHCYKA